MGDFPPVTPAIPGLDSARHGGETSRRELMKSQNRRFKTRTVSVLAATATIGAMGLLGAGAAHADPGCLTAGTSGFTAAVVADQGQTIAKRTVDATGCDVGIYVDSPGVTIDRVTVTGANAAGILAQNTSHVVVSRSIVTGNGYHTVIPVSHESTNPGELPQAFGISMFGVSHATISRNTVYDNGRGGIGVMDNGPFDPGQIVGTPPPSTVNVPVTDVTIERNRLWSNYAGCAIVVSAFNTGNTVSHVEISRNTIHQGAAPFGPTGPDVGGIVAQSNGVDSVVSDITISRNDVSDSGEAGVIVHAAAPGSMTKDVMVERNMLSGNNWLLASAPETAGVVVNSRLAPADLGQMNVNTVVTRNTMTGQFYGVWAQGPETPTVSRNDITVTPGGEAVHVE